MLSRISERISYTMLQHHIITNDYVDVYAYGLELLILKVILYSAVLIIALLFNAVFPGLVFVAAFVALRQFTGGYHCSDAWKCFIVSVAIFVLMNVLFLLGNAVIFDTCFIASVISVSPIIYYSPVESSNKPLTNDERIRFRRISLIISISLILISGLFYIMRIREIFFPVSYALLTDSILIITGKELQNEESDS